MKGKPAYQRLFTQLCRGYSRNSGQTLSGEEGLTLIECIMAIVVIGLTGAAIAPMMLVSVATRVQSQKTEQALELAQSEIDGVRVLFEQGEVTPALLPPVLTGVTNDRAPEVAGPIALTDTATRIQQVDVNNDGTLDFVVQSFLVSKTGAADTYEMGVRVYEHRAVADNSGGALATDEARIGMTGSEGERTEKPLSVVYTNVSRTEQSESLCNLIDYTDTTGTPVKPPSCS
mgnify:CR=1 FL=1